MNEPILYVKTGCPHCVAAMKYLDDQKIAYQKTEVVGNEAAMDELKSASGQTRTPTLVWGDQVLADFGVGELQKFLSERRAE